MINLNVDKWNVSIKAEGDTKKLFAEITLANMELIKTLAQTFHVPFEKASLILMQSANYTYKSNEKD